MTKKADQENEIKRGPKPKPEKEKGKTVAAHVSAELANAIEELRFTRERKASVIIAECIQAGMIVVAEKYNATRALPNDYKTGDKLPK